MIGLIRLERGGTTTEFAFLAPIFMMMIFLILDGGRMLFNKQALNELATAAARCAALKPAGCTTKAEVESWAATRGTQRSRLALTASMVTATMSTTCNGQASMAQVSISKPNAKSAMGLLPQGMVPATLTATACFPVAPVT